MDPVGGVFGFLFRFVFTGIHFAARQVTAIYFCRFDKLTKVELYVNSFSSWG